MRRSVIDTLFDIVRAAPKSGVTKPEAAYVCRSVAQR